MIFYIPAYAAPWKGAQPDTEKALYPCASREKRHRVSRDTKTEKNCRVPQFFVLSLPYRGGLEGWMLLCFFLRAEESKKKRHYPTGLSPE